MNVAAIKLWDAVELVRREFERAGYPKLRRTHVIIDGKLTAGWDEGLRTVAQTSADGLRMWLAPRMMFFDRDRQLALLAHEFGHAVQGLYGLDVEDEHNTVERDADNIGEHVMRRPLYYAMIEGRLIQTFDPSRGVRPRPLGLHLNYHPTPEKKKHDRRQRFRVRPSRARRRGKHRRRGNSLPRAVRRRTRSDWGVPTTVRFLHRQILAFVGSR